MNRWKCWLGFHQWYSPRLLEVVTASTAQMERWWHQRCGRCAKPFFAESPECDCSFCGGPK